MKLSSNIRTALAAALIAGLMAASTCLAQLGNPSNPMAGMDENLVKLLGKNNTFTAKAEVEMKDGPQGPIALPMEFLMLDGKTRMELDMTQIRSATMPVQVLTQLKQMGMEKLTLISRSDLKSSYLIYPGLKAYAEMPKNSAADTTSKTETTALNKETIDGHPCQKNKVVITDKSGEKHESIVWNATDLKDFPIQIQMKDQDQTVMLKYKNIKFQKPDAKLFDAPLQFKRYTSLQELMKGELMSRLMSKP